MEQHFNLGAKLKARYIDQLGFLSATYKKNEVRTLTEGWTIFKKLILTKKTLAPTQPSLMLKIDFCAKHGR